MNEKKKFEIKCLECGSEDFKIKTVTGYTFDTNGHQDFYTKGFKIICNKCNNEQILKK